MARSLTDEEQEALKNLLATWYSIMESKGWGSLFLGRADAEESQYRVLTVVDWQRLAYAVEEFDQLWDE